MAGFDDAFTYVGATFGKHVGEMTVSFLGGVTTVELDVNGDGRADYQMKINGDVTGETGGWLLLGTPGGQRKGAGPTKVPPLIFQP